MDSLICQQINLQQHNFFRELVICSPHRAMPGSIHIMTHEMARGTYARQRRARFLVILWNVSTCPRVTYPIKIGSFLFDAMKSEMKEGVLANFAIMPRKTLFVGANLCKKIEEEKLREYIYVGSMQVEIKQEAAG